MLATAFTWWGSAVTWLEVWALVLALACVVCNVFEIHWGWPLAIASSLLYGWLFYANRLYGDAGLQGFFVVTAAWGWWQWLFGHRADAPRDPLRPAPLGARRGLALAAVWLAGWGLLGLALDRGTDTDVPYFDAFPTVGSLLGQVLLGRKYVENWLVWLVVNAVSVALYAYKDLWLTAALYAVFFGLSVIGWMRWSGKLPRGGEGAAA